MRNIRIESEVIQLSIYCDIIMAILKRKKILSINKIITYAYLLKKNGYLEKEVFGGNNSKGLVIKSLSLLNGLGDDYLENIPYIIKSLDVLIHSNAISQREEIIMLEDREYRVTTTESLFFQRAIEASDNFTDRQFLKEVLNNV